MAAKDIHFDDRIDDRAGADLHRDPITGAPGAHPLGTGAGAAGGAVAGAAAGALAGPVGAAAGLVVGAVAGGLGGKAVAERVNPTAEDAYWRDNYGRETYYDAAYDYADYGPAYELGWSSRATRPEHFDMLEPTLATEWSARRGTSGLDWDDARPATRAAWERADRTYFGADDAPPRASSIDDDAVDVMNDLLENARDGEYGFRSCAEQVESARLQQVFNERSIQCRRAAEELVQWITRRGGQPADGGTTAGAFHRGWVSLKGAVGANSEVSILEEAERGEDAALARYRKALKADGLPADVRSLIERQMEGAQRNHDQIKLLRDQAKAVAR